MGKKMEQFISNLNNAPEGELMEAGGKLSVPRSIRKKTGERIGDKMRNLSSVSRSEDEETKGQADLIEDEIRMLENQKEAVGEKIYADIILPAIEEKKKQFAKMKEDAEEEKNKPGERLPEKKKKTKEILLNIAEKENVEAQKIEAALVYLPEKVIDYTADYCFLALGGEEKVKEQVIADYLSGKILPVEFSQQIQEAERVVKSAKIKKLGTVKDTALRQKLSDAVANVPITQAELAQALNFKGKDISLAVITMAMDEAIVASRDLETVISVATVAEGKRRDELVLWFTEERLRRAKLKTKYSRKNELPPKELSELLELDEKEREMNDKEDRRTGKKEKDMVWAFLEEFEGLKKSAFQLDNLSDEAEKLINGLEAGFELAFTNKLDQSRAETEKLYADYIKKKQELAEFEREVGQIMVDPDSLDLDNKKLKNIVDRLGEIEKEINKIQKNILRIARDAKDASVSYDRVLEQVLNDRKNNIRQLSIKIESLSPPKKWKYEFGEKKTEVEKKLKETENRGDREKSRSGSFEKNINFSQKVAVLNGDRDKILELTKKDYRDQQPNSAREALNYIYIVVSAGVEKKEKEKTQLAFDLDKIDREIDIIAEEIEKLKGKSLVWDKKGKLKALEDKMEERNNEAVRLRTELDNAQNEIRKANSLILEINKLKKGNDL